MADGEAAVGRRPVVSGGRYARPHARARRLRGRRHEPRGRATPAVHRRIAPRGRRRPDRPARRRARPALRRADVPLAPRPDPGPRGLRRRLPDPRRRLAVLDRDRLDAQLDDRLRAPLQPAPPADRLRGVRPGPARRPAGRAALLRPDAPDRTRPDRESWAGFRRQCRCRSTSLHRTVGDGRRSWSTCVRPGRLPHGHIPGSLSIPAGLVVRDLARLGRRPRPAGSCFILPGSVDELAGAPGTTPIRQAFRIGHEFDGRLPRRWPRRPGSSAGLPVESNGRLNVAELAAVVDRGGGPDAPLVIDVRQASEFADGHVGRRLAHRGGGAARAAGRAAPRPPDRGDLRGRLPGQRGRLAPRRGRFHQRQLGGRRQRRLGWPPGLPVERGAETAVAGASGEHAHGHSHPA